MKALFIMLLPIVFMSCNSNNKDSVVYGAKSSYNESTAEHPGKKLMETNCYVCHSPTASHDGRIGPPMIAVKKHYINSETTKQEFIEAMQAWIKNPNEENAKMRGAVRRFGVMPKQYFPEATIEKISDYIFDNAIEQPEWFEDHFNEEMGKGKGKGRNQSQRQN
jgi:mono/diheme cytochrome c family protein